MNLFSRWLRRPAPFTVLGAFAKLNIAKGDVVVLMTPHAMSVEAETKLMQYWQEKFGDDIALFVIPDGAKMAVLSPDSARRAQQAMEQSRQADKSLNDFLSMAGDN